MVTATDPKVCFLQVEDPTGFAAIEAALRPKCLLLAAALGPEHAQAQENQRFELEDLMLSAYQMWSFHQASAPLEPF